MERQAKSLRARSDRPPPPRRFQRHSKTPLVIGEESISRTRHYYFRRCKKASPTNIYCLPDDLLSDILARLPADYLYDRARLVCRRWYHIICSNAFVNQQFHHSKCGLLLACPTEHPCHPIFMTATQAGGVETYELSYRYLNELVNCCNGFVIEMGVDELNCPAYFLFIVNPATKQSLVLPPVQIPGAGAPSTYFSCMAFAASSMKYKIAMAYSRNSLMELAILTIGVDNSWRHVNTDHLPKHKCQVLHGYALMSDGFIHWPSICFNLVITMDVETEILTWGPYPHESKGFLDLCHLSTGRSLSMVVNCKGVFSWEIWEMISGSGEWRRVLPDIKLGGLLHAFAATGKDEAFTALLHRFTSKRAYVVLLPIGWVNYPEVLAFRFNCKSSRTCILYNRVRHEISTIELPRPCADYICRVHKDSLRRLC